MGQSTKGIPTTPMETEMKVLAMMVRGDRQEDIAKEVGLNRTTVIEIKKRNQETLDIMRAKLADHRLGQATKILDKANKAIERRVDRQIEADTQLDRIRKRFEAGEIDITEYRQQIAGLEKTTLTELVAVSKEMHSQAKTEMETLKNPAGSPQETKQRLIDLVEAIKAGDEVALERIVFKKAEVAQ